MLQVTLPTNGKQKLKLKKNALDFVDFEAEKKIDPKFKTELCKTFKDLNFCPYGNKCRFAHGKTELFNRSIDTNKYKQKVCNSFQENGFCVYGSRCNFKHGEKKLEDIDRSYYHYLLNIDNREEELYSFTNFDNFNFSFSFSRKNNFNIHNNDNNSKRRLNVFKNITKTSERSLSTSVSSNDESSLSPPNNKVNNELYNNFLENNNNYMNINNINNNNIYLNLSQASFFPKNFLIN
jgi:hypothetical protein